MSSWIDLINFIDPSFIKTPKAVTLTAPNGVGKTTSMCRLIAYLFGFKTFDRIYFVFPSHEISKKIVNHLVNFGASNIIHYQGIERVCINKKLLEEVKKLGLNPSFACSRCPHNIFNIKKIRDFNEKLRYCAKFVKEYFRNNNKVLDSAKYRPYDWSSGNIVCLQPLVKYIVVYPQIDTYLKDTIIILCPYSIFASKPIIIFWRRFFKRQRAIRKYIAVFDECDHIIYSGFSYRISKPDFTQFDNYILQKYSTRSTKLTKYIEFYNRLYNTLKDVSDGYIDPEDAVPKITDLFKAYSKIIKKVADLVPEISLRAYESKERTFIVSSVGEVFSIEYFTECMAMTVEETSEGIIIQDIDFAYRILYDINFPFKYWWKLSTTATFPQPEIFRDSKLIEKGKEAIEYVETIDIYPENVSIFTFLLFPELFSDVTFVSRNELIEQRLDCVAILLKESYKLYKEITGTLPRGAIVFTGNKYQFNVLKDLFTELIVHDSEGLFVINFMNTNVYFTYCASKYARGLDFDNLDISIVLAPLVRPPRPSGTLDSLDIARATAEAIQSAFRIVRSLRPSRHKLLGFEANILLKKTYNYAFPTWFSKLLFTLAQTGHLYKIKLCPVGS